MTPPPRRGAGRAARTSPGPAPRRRPPRSARRPPAHVVSRRTVRRGAPQAHRAVGVGGGRPRAPRPARSGRPGGTRRPVLAVVTTSGTPPTALATTGRARAIASSSVSGRPFPERGQHHHVGGRCSGPVSSSAPAKRTWASSPRACTRASSAARWTLSREHDHELVPAARTAASASISTACPFCSSSRAAHTQSGRPAWRAELVHGSRARGASALLVGRIGPVGDHPHPRTVDAVVAAPATSATAPQDGGDRVGARQLAALERLGCGR